MALRVLRHRPGRLRAPPHHRRDRRAGRARPPAGPRRRRRLANVVFMGMGEPLANYDRDVGRGRAAPRRPRPLGPPPHAVDRRHRARHPPAGRRGAAGQPGGVAARRQRRAARRAGADQPALPARRAGRARAPTTCGAKGRRLSFEWALIDGVNDRAADAARAGRAAPGPLRRPRQPHPAQPHARLPDRGARRRTASRAFRDRLGDLGVNATVRRNRGTDIDAACGQLRAGHGVELRTAPASARSAHQHGDAVAGPDGVDEALARGAPTRPGHTTERSTVAVDLGARRPTTDAPPAAARLAAR